VRNKQETIYCDDDLARQLAIRKLGNQPEITSLKGLGEISPDEFGRFISQDMRLEPVIMRKDTTINDL
jgi:topoisomerase IV subunit B